MKIFMIFDGPLNAQDASITHLFEVFNNLSDFAETYLFAEKPRQNIEKRKNIIYVPVLKIPNFIGISFQIVLFFSLIYYRYVHSPDVFYCRFSKFSYSPVLISKIFKIPLIFEVNGLLEEEIRMINNSKLEILLTKLSEKVNLKRATRIIAVTPGIKQDVEESFGLKNIVVISNGVNTELFRPLNPEDVKNSLGLDHETRYICFVGSFAPWQGLDCLILAASTILQEHANVKFLFVGDGALKDELVELAKKQDVYGKCLFTGAIAYEEVPLYINVSEVCIAYKKRLKSGYSPLKLYEYMSCGKPVIASRVDGFEILEKINAGILAEPENSRELASAILKLLNNEGLQKEMGYNGNRYVLENHSWKIIAEQIFNLCTEIAADDNFQG